MFHSDDGQWVSLRERAAFDLDCARDSLEVVPLTAETFGVTGCGKRATYNRSDVVGFALDYNATPGKTNASTSASVSPPASN